MRSHPREGTKYPALASVGPGWPVARRGPSLTKLQWTQSDDARIRAPAKVHDKVSSTTIRPARAEDHAFVAAMVPELGSGDPPPSAERFAARMQAGTLIAEVGGRAAGYIHRQLLRGEVYVRHVVVAPGFRGRGVGRALMHAVRDEARKLGANTWRLNVKPENTPAVELYRSVGMLQVHTSVALRFAWGLEARLPAAPDPIELRTPPPENLPTLEARFGVPAGQLHSLSQTRGVFVRAVHRAHTTKAVGVVAFDVGFPGCFPFCIEDPADVGDTLRALQKLATQDDMGVVVEGHDTLAQALIDAGAEVKVRFVHMCGALG